MKSVLIIEDNPDNRRLLMYAFSRADFRIIEAESGEQGLEVLRGLEPDLIVVDINLPGMDGLETARRIREVLPDPTVAIVAITSYAMKGDRERILAAGCNAYFEKPIDPLTIVQTIHDTLQERNR